MGILAIGWVCLVLNANIITSIIQTNSFAAASMKVSWLVSVDATWNCVAVPPKTLLFCNYMYFLFSFHVFCCIPDDDRYDKTDEVVVARSSDSDDDILVIESPKGDKTQCPERSEGKSSAPCVIEETTAAPTTSNKISRESDDKILQTIRSSSSLFIDGNNPFYDYGSDPLGSFNGYHPWSDLRQPEPELDNKTNTSDSTSGSQGRKRSLSSDCTSISSVPHKKRYATAPMSDLQSMETVVGECLICLVCVDNANLFKCIQGHPCCGDCLQKSAKRTLEHKREVMVYNNFTNSIALLLNLCLVLWRPNLHYISPFFPKTSVFSRQDGLQFTGVEIAVLNCPCVNI